MVTRAPEVLAIVPAPGASRSIPGKNVRIFCGHPLLAWSIVAAQRSPLVQRVVVSTDNEEIAGIARAYGAETPFRRPSDLGRDDARDLPVFQHALEWLSHHEGYRPAIVAQLRPASPLRPQGLIDEAIRLLLSDESGDSVRSVTPPSQDPFKMWSIRHGALEPIVKSSLREAYNAPRQSLPQTFWQTGHLDVIRSSTIRQHGSMSGDRILPILVNPSYALDLDESIQWRLAEELLAEGNHNVAVPRIERSTGPLHLHHFVSSV